MAKAPAAPGLPAVAVKISDGAALVMSEPAIRVERRPREDANNFRKRIALLAKKRGYAVGTFETAEGMIIPQNGAPEAEGGDGAKRLAVIYLHGRDTLGRAIGPNDFRLSREPGEAEEAFRLRALQAGVAKRLPWLAFEKPALPAAPAFDEAQAD